MVMIMAIVVNVNIIVIVIIMIIITTIITGETIGSLCNGLLCSSLKSGVYKTVS